MEEAKAIDHPELLKFVRSTGIKLQLPMNVILDAILYVRAYMTHESFPDSSHDQVMLVSASLYLSTKVNEYFGNENGQIRIRDFLNVAIYAQKEGEYFEKLKKDDALTQGLQIG
jgi:hypothetical protein